MPIPYGNVIDAGQGQLHRQFRQTDAMFARKGRFRHGESPQRRRRGRARQATVCGTSLFGSDPSRSFILTEQDDPHGRRIARHPTDYRHSPASTDPRKEHVAWDGLILKHDDPWWASHTPPNGFGCKCYIETLAERDMKKGDLTVTDKDRIKFNGDDPKTGLPQGVDKDWDYQPGANQTTPLYDLIARKLPKMDAPLGAAMMKHLKDALAMETQLAWMDTLDEWLADEFPRGKTAMVGSLDPDILKWLADHGKPTPATAEISIRDNLPRGTKQARHEADQNGLTLDEWRSLPSLLSKPGAIYMDNHSGKMIFVSESVGPTKAALEFEPKKTKGGDNLIVSAFRVSDEAIAGSVKGKDWTIIKVPGRRMGVEPT